LGCTSRSWRASSRSQIACSKASRARSLFSELDTRQPTIRREYTSITNATYTKPRHVATYVRSETHNWFGRSAVKLRSTTSSGRAAAPPGIVVSLKRRPRTEPVSPSCSISRSTHELEHRDEVVPLIPTRRGRIRDRTEAGRARKRARRRQSTQRYRKA